MIYDLDTVLDRERFKKRVNALFERRKIVECSEHKPKRTDPQNRYLHAILGEFAMQTGYTLEHVKVEYFKKLCNPTLFIRKKTDRFSGEVKELRSSADLDTGEMTEAIARFRNWSSSVAEIYLPDKNEKKYLQSIEREMQHHRIWI
ncbi:MAG: recombination protein NinB [Alistipes sp.]